MCARTDFPPRSAADPARGALLMPCVRIPSALRAFTKGAADVELSATSVRGALAELERLHPGIGAKLFEQGALRPFIRIFVGSDDISALGGLDARVGDRDEI